MVLDQLEHARPWPLPGLGRRMLAAKLRQPKRIIRPFSCTSSGNARKSRREALARRTAA